MPVPDYDVRLHREPRAELAPGPAHVQRLGRGRRRGRRGHERPRGGVLLHGGGAGPAHVVAAHALAPGHGEAAARGPRVPEAAGQRGRDEGSVRAEQQPRRQLGGLERPGVERRLQLEQLVVREQQLLAGLGQRLGRLPGPAHQHSRRPAAALVHLGLGGHLPRQHKDVTAKAPEAVPAVRQLPLPARALGVGARHGLQGARLADPEGPRRHQEVPEGVRHGAPGAVVHAVQVEEGVHALRRLGGVGITVVPRRHPRRQNVVRVLLDGTPAPGTHVDVVTAGPRHRGPHRWCCRPRGRGACRLRAEALRWCCRGRHGGPGLGRRPPRRPRPAPPRHLSHQDDEDHEAQLTASTVSRGRLPGLHLRKGNERDEIVMGNVSAFDFLIKNIGQAPRRASTRPVSPAKSHVKTFCVHTRNGLAVRFYKQCRKHRFVYDCF
ncbi:hypothetical protein ONE63_006885 [Megalurothrips usitatus]|uniref:Uncharacterized protein n=1 Tax=Megalurothrips usitatus TaxID=439358 RepID=A0AAV7XSU0_9NEOP|nr:hypothetical protein ONE63_006885 [Megalurothrips usitatus]